MRIAAAIFMATLVIVPQVGCRDGVQATPAANRVASGTAEDPDAQIIFRKDGMADVSFDSLKFDIEPGEDYDDSMMRDHIRALDGKRIIIRGFMLPGSVYRDTGIKEFVLIRDNQQCCFGPGAKLYHNMQVEMAEGKTANFSTIPVAVEGTFSVRPWYAPDGKCYSVYHIQADSVKR